MNKFRTGFAEAMIAVVMGIALTAIIASFAEDGTLPSYSPLVFGIISFIVNLSVINSFQEVGILYTLGWLIGAWLLKDSLSVVGSIINIGGPILVLILRAWFVIKSAQK